MRGYFSAYRSRKPDPSVAQALAALLPPRSELPLLDLGSGSGGYASLLAGVGRRVLLVDRSVEQLTGAPPDLNRVASDALALPLATGSCVGCYSILALHQFGSLKASLREAARVSRDKFFCALTFDRRKSEKFWLGDYFPEVWWGTYDRFPTVEEQAAQIASAFGRPTQLTRFELPREFGDGWLAGGWDRPWLYLQANYRAANSSFHLVPEEAVDLGVARLAKDLETGEWENRYGAIDISDSFNAGYFFVTTV